MADGGGGGGGEGGGSGEWLPIFDRVEAMVSKSQAQAASLVADRARLAAADRVQRESWEATRRLQRSVEELQAAAREKEAEMDRLRAEAADSRKKLQADAFRNLRWEAAYVELLLGANQKLAELREGDMEYPRICAETPNSKDESGSDEDDAEQIGSDEDGDKHSGSDVDGDEKSGSDEKNGSGDDDDDNERKGDVRPWLRNWKAPAPLRSRKLKISNGRRVFYITGHWGGYVKAVNDSLVDQPDKHKEFGRFLRNFEKWRVCDVARTMKNLLDGQPKLISRFNQFLPSNCQIEVNEEERQHPEHQPGIPRPGGQPSSAAAAAGLIKLKEVEQQPSWEQPSPRLDGVVQETFRHLNEEQRTESLSRTTQAR